MRALLTLLALVSLSAHAAGLLKDTGITTCFNGANLVACSDANTGDSVTGLIWEVKTVANMDWVSNSDATYFVIAANNVGSSRK
jgi:hypothetical protein